MLHLALTWWIELIPVMFTRWILGVVMAGSASCASITWALMDDRQFHPANECGELPDGVCSFGWGVLLPIGPIFLLFHIFMLIARIRGNQQGNTVSLFLCGACQLMWMSLIYLWKQALQIDADSDDSLKWIDTFTNISIVIILLTWLVRAAYMFKYGLCSS